MSISSRRSSAKRATSRFPRIGQPGFSFGGAVEAARRAGKETPIFLAHPTQGGLDNMAKLLLAAGISAGQIVRPRFHGMRPEAERSNVHFNQTEQALVATTTGWNNFLYVQEPTKEQASLFTKLYEAACKQENPTEARA